MNLPTFGGRKINRLLFFLFLSITCVVLAVTALLSIFSDGYNIQALLVLAVITGVTSVFYGVYWAYYVLRQKFMYRWFSEEQEEEEEEGEEPACYIEEEFVLPRQELIAAAENRFRSVFRWVWIILPFVFLAIASILAFSRALTQLSQLLYLLAFCVLISIPGLVVQYVIKTQYASSVPERISLSPGKLSVDGTDYKVKELESVRVSRERSRDPHSVSVFRRLEVFTLDGRDRYRIDFGAGSDVVWDAYPHFVSILSLWGDGNGVTVTTEDRD